MIIKINPYEVGDELADELLVELHKHKTTESSCFVYYHLRDSNQSTVAGEITIPYKILKWEILKVEGKDFEKIKQDENNAVEYVINKLGL